MAELDVLSPTGYDETRLGSLIVRVAAIEPPQHPLGPDYAEPHWGIYCSAVDADPGWLAMNATPKPDDALETLDNRQDLLRTEKLSICIGATWAAICESALQVAKRQEAAVLKLPPQVYEATLEELRAVRGNLNIADPVIVAMLLGMTYHWQTDPGGTYGPRFD